MNLPLHISLNLLAFSLAGIVLHGQAENALPLPKYDPLVALTQTDKTMSLAETTLVQNVSPAAGPESRWPPTLPGSRSRTREWS